MTIIAFPPVAGLIEVVEDIEREDGNRPEGPDEAFYRLVRQLVPVLADEEDVNRDLDRHLSDDELDELLGGEQAAVVDTGSMAEESRPACGGCGGTGGHTETSYDDDGTRRDTWRSCGACGGSGQG